MIDTLMVFVINILNTFLYLLLSSRIQTSPYLPSLTYVSWSPVTYHLKHQHTSPSNLILQNISSTSLLFTLSYLSPPPHISHHPVTPFLSYHLPVITHPLPIDFEHYSAPFKQRPRAWHFTLPISTRLSPHPHPATPLSRVTPHLSHQHSHPQPRPSPHVLPGW